MLLTGEDGYIPCNYCPSKQEYNDEGETWVYCDCKCSDHIYGLSTTIAKAQLQKVVDDLKERAKKERENYAKHGYGRDRDIFQNNAYRRAKLLESIADSYEQELK